MEIFIRHKISKTPDVFQQLWDGNYIALHYENKLSVDPNDYAAKSAKHSIKRLLKFCNEGGFVGAVYCDNKLQGQMLVGKISPNSKLIGKTFIDRTNSEKVFHYKVVQLTDCRKINLIQHPVLASLQPRQGALCEWRSAKGIVKALVNNKPLPFAVTSLHYGQLEVLCYEYLRHKQLLNTLLAPIGRTMIDVDILGLNSNYKKVVAQVTFGSDSEKLTKLEIYKSDAETYFFSEMKTKKVNGIECISIYDVFDEMSKIDEYKNMLSVMFG